MAATAAVRSFAAHGPAHAVLLTGPPSVGKTTLAIDLAAALLCHAKEAADRPCGACRGCRLVASGNHPDLHRLAPEGAGVQIRIGEQREPEPNTIRWLIRELALLPLEGDVRVAILEHAERLNEAAQQALLKTLEEPPEGVTIVLCADDEERLLPTVRSRCARIRLGPLAVRDIEGLLGELDLADPPTAGRLARIAAGRPGLAVAYAQAPQAAAIRGEVARTLLDLLGASRAVRLGSIRELLSRAHEAVLALSEVEGASASPRPSAPGRGARSASRSPASAGRDASGASDPGPDGAEAQPADDPDAAPVKRSATERRRAAAWLVEVWRDVCRDLAMVGLGDPRAVRDTGLLGELEAAGVRLEPRAAAAFLVRLARAGELLDANVSPELTLDVLALSWPRVRATA